MVKKVTYSSIIELFLNDYIKRYYLREIAGLLGKPHQTIKPYLEELCKDRILIKHQRQNIIDYSLNLDNKKTFIYVCIAEQNKLLTQMQKDNYLEILYDKIYPYFGKSTFIIFGSAVNNIKNASDIDLLVISRQNVNKGIREFEMVYNKKVHKVQVSDSSKITTRLIKEIYKKHIILNNAGQVIQFLGELVEKNFMV